ncbi:MAG: sigma-70 family RNA polymerase sigma factor [Burkholderiales bacterium]
MSRADGAWFAGQVEHLLPDLLGTAMRLTRNRADAEDLVADAVAKAWVGFDSLEQREALRGWVFRILTNTFFSSRRAAVARGVHEPLDDEVGEAAHFSLFERLHQPFLLWWGNPEQAFFDKLLREDLERAIDALPDPFRGVVVLVDVQGYSYQEVAEVLGIPIGTVRSRLARGRATLQRTLWEHARDAGLIGTAGRNAEEAP